jgi:hypothetical protein
VANEGEGTLAMLVRRDGETLSQLPKRLDLAIARAQGFKAPIAGHSRIRQLFQDGRQRSIADAYWKSMGRSMALTISLSAWRQQQIATVTFLDGLMRRCRK